MKICVFGLGSIGQRHTRLLRQLGGHELWAFRSFKGQEPTDWSGPMFQSWDEFRQNLPEAALIANPTFLHVSTAQECVNVGVPVFLEKPLGSSLDGLDVLEQTIQTKKVLSYVGYVLRFHPAIVFLKEYLKDKKILQVSVNASSYLPDWRPNQDHLQSYSAFKDKGGGVVLELSHEFDYIEYLFGKIAQIHGSLKRLSEVTVDAEDCCDAVVVTEKTRVNVHLDFMSFSPERKIRIDLPDQSLVADLMAARIDFFQRGHKESRVFPFERDDMFVEQLKYFLSHVTERKTMMNNISEAAQLFRQLIHFKEGQSL
ncbi:MAG: Gfo/Idh/MocA family oxidoreductase [Candidatus Omnitrophica bacterium]|nr:Gfo/Idh/MocA family oxidoreductase [Candidatus Omnitrophota bacterium]